ncbi:MAG: replication-associated recombination protein A [Defluviitaleaceae bacterium]|nr:replication-associated recombination protein A [Defluviitaleaceae bacterium]
MKPLADLVRPQTLDEVVGQQHLIAEGSLLKKLLDVGHLPNMIFYGPSGTGKTTIANIIAKTSNKKIFKLNATVAKTSDIKEVIDHIPTLEAANGILLYLDEIQNFNKKQQQTVLKYIENGDITLIASTTENPYFTIFGAILSRSTILEFKSLTPADIERGLVRAFAFVNEELMASQATYEADALIYLAHLANGDLRKALNFLEIAMYPNMKQAAFRLTKAIAKACTQTAGFSYDKFGDVHYDTLSAFHKSLRGSDADAAIHYLARLIHAGDLTSICRRLLAVASEDVGLAYPQAVVMTKACVDSAVQLGFPEANLPLAQATVLLALAPKSNSTYVAINRALDDLKKGDVGEIPLYLKDAHYNGAKKLGRGIDYQYPHDEELNYVKQQYLPDALKARIYYEAGMNKIEQGFQTYWQKLKSEIDDGS